MNKRKRALMSGLILITVVAVIVALSVYANQQRDLDSDPVKRVERALGIAFPADTVFEWQGLEENEDEVFLKAVLPEGSAETLLNELSRSASWSSEPVREDVRVFIYNGVYDGVQYYHNIASYFGIPESETAYWFFADRDEKKHTNNSFLTADRYNLIFSLLDPREDTLYYYETER